jgi:Flp pilus assembly pilin Flp
MHAFLSLLGSLVARLGCQSRRGQTLVEYALILAVIVIVCVGALTALGNKVIYVFSTITSLLDTAQAGSH